MSLINALIQEIERESEATKKALERVPEGKFEWQPHEKSATMLSLARHLAELMGMPAAILNLDELDLAVAEPRPEIKSADDLVKLFKVGKIASLDALKSAKEEDLSKKWLLKYGDRILREGTKEEMIREMGLSHAYHHRAQLGVYLRLLDIPVPSTYGPSADEQ